MKPISLLRLLSFFAILSFLFFSNSAQASILYVKSTAAGANNGSSWVDAFTNLQVAIDSANTGDEIWVAGGVYLPTSTHTDTSDRYKTFYIAKSIKIYGGFEGTEGTESLFESRKVFVYNTYLSGDLGVAGDPVDNSFHVVWLDHVGSNMVLDGFTISGGYGHEGSGFDNTGAGMVNDGTTAFTSNPVIANCIFENNSATESGGAVLNYGTQGEANPTFINCSFKNNSGSGGGAVANLANPSGFASPTFINCEFKGNSGPTAGGGAVTNIALNGGNASPILYNCLFSGNFSPTSGAYHSFANANGNLLPHFVNCTFAGNFGGAISTSAIGGSTAIVGIINSIFWGNSGGGGITENGATTTVEYSIVPFGQFPGEGNIDADPLFVDLPDLNTAPTVGGDLHLQPTSPAVDAGNDEAVNPEIQTDLSGLPRFVDPVHGGFGKIDLGAYELQPQPTATSEINSGIKWNITPNPAPTQVELSMEPMNAKGFLRVFDLDGKIVFQKQIEPNTTNFTLSTGNLPAGIYLVHLMINGRSAIKKLVVG
jgi:hypothetical protein